MTDFSTFEVIRAVISLFLYGALCGSVYSAGYILLSFLKRTLSLPLDTVRFLRAPSLSGMREAVKHSYTHTSGKIGKNLSDCLLFFLFGLGFIILNYILLDGALRAYTVFFVIVGALAANITVAKIFSVALTRFLNAVSYVLFMFFVICIFPLTKIAYFAVKFLMTLMEPIMRAYRKMNSRRLVRQKIANISVIIRKIYK